MKTREELEQDYEKYFDDVCCGKRHFAWSELGEHHSVEELETLAGFGWSDDAGEDLYRIFILRRRTKMNMQFVFNKENIEAIVRVDKRLKECCRQLKEETEKLCNFMSEQERGFDVSGTINIRKNNDDSFFDCAISVLDYNLLSFVCRDIRDIDHLAFFNFDRNYADKVLSYNTQRMMVASNAFEGGHIGYAFYELYRNGCLSLQDIVDDIEFHMEIHLRQWYSKK